MERGKKKKSSPNILFSLTSDIRFALQIPGTVATTGQQPETEAVEREEEESRLLARPPVRRPVAKNEKSEREERRGEGEPVQNSGIIIDDGREGGGPS